MSVVQRLWPRDGAAPARPTATSTSPLHVSRSGTRHASSDYPLTGPATALVNHTQLERLSSRGLDPREYIESPMTSRRAS